MVRRHISDDVKKKALSMSLQGMCDSDIRQSTGVSERSLKRLRSTYRKTGAVSVKPIAPGRARLLTSMEVKVRQSFFSRVFEHLITVFSYGYSFFVIALSARPI
jgi:transposase